MSGNKIMTLRQNSMMIIDSYLFFQMSLAKLLECMGVD